MVLGICSLALLWIPFISYLCLASAVVGVILSALALKEIKLNPSLGGRGMAITGVVLSVVSLGLDILVIVACASACAGFSTLAGLM